MSGTAIRYLVMLGLASAPCLTPSARAEDPQQAFKTLVARGFKIAATTVVPAEVNKTKDPVLVVTLQLDKAVAVCTFGVGTWENMGQSLETDPKACDVRFY